jgi:hypothetical protein
MGEALISTTFFFNDTTILLADVEIKNVKDYHSNLQALISYYSEQILSAFL